MRRIGYVAAVPMKWFWCASQGVRWRYGWNLRGKPLFRPYGRDATIVIGARFTAHSKSSGNSIGVSQPVIITAWGDGSSVRIGEDCGLSGCSITALERITLGNRVLVGSGALIIDTDAHALAPEDRARDASPVVEPVTIEDDVFIGARAVVLKGVTIGQGAVIGAAAVVTNDVPPRAVVAGNPSRVVGHVPSAT